jgi:hypothetical protein
MYRFVDTIHGDRGTDSQNGVIVGDASEAIRKRLLGEALVADDCVVLVSPTLCCSNGNS